ncbi:SDR family oxidoreductase [Terasakiella sp. A23]|uniref:SDR family oxidoreductase n=1 Tax=Terasakiella sp. FCG-A23 TaxID=3080561 RepID=UPI0029532705|nr:SDR family oxidoreductase [Terasakiella sp. A23]MDV7340801.1 SDR family oxidoreductase [Terasakiella sp. A23]
MALTDNPFSSSDFFSLDGKVAVVTGGSRGIGAALAFGLAAHGARVYRLGRSREPQLADCERLTYRACDVTDEQALKNVMDEIVAKEGQLDILVNAAGVSFPPSDELSGVERFRKTIDVNLQGAYQASMLAVDVMKAQQNGGAIVNVTSINSRMGFPGNPGYVASKGGLSAMTRALAVDLGTHHIRVNALAPGYIHTDMTRASYGDPESHDARLSRMVLPRWGQPEDMIGTCVFLCSNAAAYVTGQEIFVDGGWVIKGLS